MFYSVYTEICYCFGLQHAICILFNFVLLFFFYAFCKFCLFIDFKMCHHLWWAIMSKTTITKWRNQPNSRHSFIICLIWKLGERLLYIPLLSNKAIVNVHCPLGATEHDTDSRNRHQSHFYNYAQPDVTFSIENIRVYFFCLLLNWPRTQFASSGKNLWICMNIIMEFIRHWQGGNADRWIYFSKVKYLNAVEYSHAKALVASGYRAGAQMFKVQRSWFYVGSWYGRNKFRRKRTNGDIWQIFWRHEVFFSLPH